jgi:hypothetical protein
LSLSIIEILAAAAFILLKSDMILQWTLNRILCNHWMITSQTDLKYLIHKLQTSCHNTYISYLLCLQRKHFYWCQSTICQISKVIDWDKLPKSMIF